MLPRNHALGDENVLFARKSPVLSVETLGPRRITVGKESAYEVTVLNAGEVAADEVVVFVNLPAWADVLGADASTGATQAAIAGGVGVPFQWKVGHIEPRERERLVLRIVPRESRPFDLAVRWDCQPVASEAMIEVQEPKLELSLDGPDEVLYGEKEVFKLTVSNVGTGDAENVVITLAPAGAGEGQPVSHNLGVIEAGGDKAIEVELTARQVGDLLIKVAVRGNGGVHAELAEQVLVRRAGLQVDIQGPTVQYVGAVSNYSIRVSNPGNAPARNVELSVNMPPGARYLSGIDNSRLDANGSQVVWTLDELKPASEKSFVIQCTLGQSGSSLVEVVSTGEGDLAASASAATRVEAIADLALVVKDPSGPVPVGEETVYEVRIRNRGTKNAQNVEVLAYFSRGIEPIKAEGIPHRISAGQVVFSPIPSLPAGADMVLTIYARAETAGNHSFRAEVHCKPTGTRLLSEETTHYYRKEAGAPQISSRPPGTAAAPRDAEALPVSNQEPLPAGPPAGPPLGPLQAQPMPTPLR
ncbi:MAG: hypothetical protein JXB62_05660 [Pirellulales bacterium]|nr:hypothetical protein [Pirellulales bacterium]